MSINLKRSLAVAALANLNVLLIDLEFSFFGLSEASWTATLVGLGIFGGLLVLYINRDLWFALVLIWAFLGIYVKNSDGTAAGSRQDGQDYR